MESTERAGLETKAAIITTIDIQKRNFLKVNSQDGTYFGLLSGQAATTGMAVF
jgi:hypothetical protein